MLPNPWIHTQDSDQLMQQTWPKVVDWDRVSWSISDRLPPPKKDFINPIQRLFWKVLSKKNFRKLLATVDKAWLADEHPICRLLVNRAAFASATLLLKTNQVPVWTAWVLRNCPNALVVHVVRHPGGVLRAWRKRHWEIGDKKQIASESRNRLMKISEVWKSRIQVAEMDTMSAAEMEAWTWCYETEMIQEAGMNSPRYLLVKDEDVWNTPVRTTEQIFAFCDLQIDAAVSNWITSIEDKWMRSTHAWDSELSQSEKATVEQILELSLMKSWWKKDQKVSGSEYRAY